MAIPHATPGQVFDARSVGEEPQSTLTKTLIKTSHLEVIRLALPAGKEIPTHKTKGEIIVQCIQGRVGFTTMGQTRELTPGQMLYLAGGEDHSVKGIEDGFLMVTISL